MKETEGQVDPGKEAYEQEISKIEDYYTEKGGVGSPDFVAFEDALKNTVLLAQKAWFKRELKLNVHGDLLDSIPGSDEHAYQNIITGINAAKVKIDSHKNSYLNFSGLYRTALRKIADVLKNSSNPKRPVIDGLSNPYLDLLMVRSKIIDGSVGASPKAP
jgi:hypothetical protein